MDTRGSLLAVGLQHAAFNASSELGIGITVRKLREEARLAARQELPQCAA